MCIEIYRYAKYKSDWLFATENPIQKRTIPERLSTFFLACALNCDKSAFDSFPNRRDRVLSERKKIIKSLAFFYHLSFIIIMHKFVCYIRFERALLHSVASFLFGVCAHNWMPFAFISSYFHRVQLQQCLYNFSEIQKLAIKTINRYAHITLAQISH